MKYFGREALVFLRGLKKNNRRPWFEAHREEYEQHVRQPMADLVEEMDLRLAGFAPEMTGDPKRSVFRIHRDIRFSSDKSPYKTNAAAWFYHGDAGRGVGSTAPHGGAGFYLHIEPNESMIGGGIWMPPRPTLTRLREPSFKKRFGTLDESAMLTRMPRGYAEDHPAADLLRHQSFTVGRMLTDAELFSPKLADLLARDYARLVPFVRWFNGALGLRTLARR